MAMNKLLPRIDKMIYCMSHEYSGCEEGNWDEEIKLLMDCREMLVKLFMLPAENVRTDAFADRCKLATDCLPDAPYRVMLENLHREMLGINQRVEP